MKNILLAGKGVYKRFTKDGSPVLDNVDADIYEGDFTVIMGASGAGKSTLLYALSGMDSLSDGRVVYKGAEISRYNERQMARLRAEEFGFVFQQTHLVSNLTLFENVAVAGYLNPKIPQSETRERSESLLRQMGVEHAANRLPHQTSGGEAQRAAIARAMIGQPGILFADEPTGALNKRSSDEVLTLLTDLNEQGQSILMVTHDLRASIRGNRILYLEDGTVLDTLVLPPFLSSETRTREAKMSEWLTALNW